jgi:hypothetical protein
LHVSAETGQAFGPEAPGRGPGSFYLGLYPRAWRERYGDELADLLEAGRLTLRSRLDLVRGALDAHLHPASPSRLPVIAALVASGLATAHALVLGIQPVPTDWPGYLEDGLPLIMGAVAALVPLTVGLWLKLGDADGALGRLGLFLGVTGHIAWLLALLAAAAHLTYGPITAAAATVAMAGTAALGVSLVGRGRIALGVLVAAAALSGIAPPSLGWPAFAAAWTAVALALIVEFAGRAAPGQGPRIA